MQSSAWASTNETTYAEDQFAQTREPDNLFDDDFTPVTEPVAQPVPSYNAPPQGPRSRGSPHPQGRATGARGAVYRGRGIRTHPGHTRDQNDAVPKQAPQKPVASDWDTFENPPIAAAPNTTEPTTTAEDTATPTATTTPSTTTTTTNAPPEDPSTTSTPPTSAPPDPSTDPTSTSSQPQPQQQQQQQPPQSQRPPAVRGPRHATGGVARPKLSETELTARLAAARLNNSKLEEAHRAAEADAASFEAREQAAQKAAKERRAQDSAARKRMESEREKNRLRKLGAKGGREWDEGKEEVKDEGRERGTGRGGRARRGVYGGVVASTASASINAPLAAAQGVFTSAVVEGGERRPSDGDGGELGGLSEVAVGEDAEGEGFQGHGAVGGAPLRGRGGRGRGRGPRGGRGRGRGDGGFETRKENVPPSQLTSADFPALAPAAPVTILTKGKEQSSALSGDGLKSPGLEKGTWADQVEAGQTNQAA